MSRFISPSVMYSGSSPKKLHAAGAVLGVGATGVHDIDPAILLDSKDQPLAFFHLEGSYALYF